MCLLELCLHFLLFTSTVYWLQKLQTPLVPVNQVLTDWNHMISRAQTGVGIKITEQNPMWSCGNGLYQCCVSTRLIKVAFKVEFWHASASKPCAFACEWVAALHGADRMCCTAACVCAANLLTSETAKFNPHYFLCVGTFLIFITAAPLKALWIIVYYKMSGTYIKKTLHRLVVLLLTGPGNNLL